MQISISERNVRDRAPEVDRSDRPRRSVSPVGLVLAVAFAILIGLAAGVYPALRASRLTRVDAIRAG